MVTKREFKQYVKVQMEGRYNMLDPRARQLTGLSKEKYTHIIKNYGELKERFAEEG